MIVLNYNNRLLIGNAETTDLFKCENKRMTCCSTKKDIKQREAELRRQQKETISRNSHNNPGIPHRPPNPPNRVPSLQSTFPVNNEDHETETDEENVKRNDSINALDFYPFPTTAERPTLEHPVTNRYVCGVKGTYR
jgi:hypothetical protein